MVYFEIELLAKQILKERKEFAEMQADQNLQTAREDVEFNKAYNQSRSLVFDIAKARHRGQNTKKMEQELQVQKDLLKANMQKIGVVPEDLKPKYTCQKCKDTGFINGTSCECRNQLISKLLLEHSGLSTTDLPSFATANFELFDADKQQTMQQLYDKMQTYSNDLKSSKKKFVTLLGNTGVGKTHLIECMVQNAIAHSYYTVYTTAFALSSDFLKYHTASLHEKNMIFSKYLNCELLVVDDLGTEPKYNNVTEEYMYLIVNERLNKGKNTVFTSNLSLQQIRDVYGERVFSRIASKDKALLIQLDNKDLRLNIK